MFRSTTILAATAAALLALQPVATAAQMTAQPMAPVKHAYVPPGAGGTVDTQVGGGCRHAAPGSLHHRTVVRPAGRVAATGKTPYAGGASSPNNGIHTSGSIGYNSGGQSSPC